MKTKKNLLISIDVSPNMTTHNSYVTCNGSKLNRSTARTFMVGINPPHEVHFQMMKIGGIYL